MVELIERLLGKGMDLLIFDQNVSIARLVGANRSYITERIPHVAALMSESIDDILDHGDLIVIGNNDPTFADVPGRLRREQCVLDLVRLPGSEMAPNGRWEGINW